MEFVDLSKPKAGGLADINRLIRQAKKYEELLQHAGAAKWFVPGTPFDIERCVKHRAFFNAGQYYPERLFMAGNRCGKSVSGAVESSFHATGLYPEWWTGRRFTTRTRGWACGDTSQTVRDTVQKELLGPPGAFGTGTIPRDRILRVYRKAGMSSGGIERVEVLHESGGISVIDFKSYEQGRKAFQGTEQEWIWLDEECPEDVYSECLIRTMTTNGLLYVTFTPLSGITPFIINFMKNAELLEGARPITTFSDQDGGDTPSPFELAPMTPMEMFGEIEGEDGVVRSGRAVVQAGWADAPWLDGEARKRMAANCPPHLLDARMYGYPSIGSGNVYPVALEDILCKPFEIPVHWKKMYALDVGWNRTAALHAAINPEDGRIYIYSEHYQGDARPEIHAAAIKAKGEWMRGVIDPASHGRAQHDGKKLINIYRQLGLKVIEAKNEVESGIYNTWGGLSMGRIKVFDNLPNFQKEYIVYGRDEKGKIIKENDHLMDCLRYIVNNIHVAIQQPHARNHRVGSGVRNGAGKKYAI